ncbi:MAG TPA: hypothetical protein VGN72_01635 [Tepidisphaeraceae bacterium]|jgi:hypothetical protein|nr:hypothetical protein [Tepidisphaeraceae bacterium]
MQREAMPTADTDNFAHGTYGDDSGVVFYGPPVEGFWDDSLPVSDRFIHPLFCAALDRAQREDAAIPKVVADWNTLTGWADAYSAGTQELTDSDAAELIHLLARVTESDLMPHVAGVTTQECVRCAAAIAEFLRSRTESGAAVYIEDD